MAQITTKTGVAFAKLESVETLTLAVGAGQGASRFGFGCDVDRMRTENTVETSVAFACLHVILSNAFAIDAVECAI